MKPWGQWPYNPMKNNRVFCNSKKSEKNIIKGWIRSCTNWIEHDD